MADHIIKIGGDFSELEKDLEKTVNKIEKGSTRHGLRDASTGRFVPRASGSGQSPLADPLNQKAKENQQTAQQRMGGSSGGGNPPNVPPRELRNFKNEVIKNNQSKARARASGRPIDMSIPTASQVNYDQWEDYKKEAHPLDLLHEQALKMNRNRPSGMNWGRFASGTMGVVGGLIGGGIGGAMSAVGGIAGGPIGAALTLAANAGRAVWGRESSVAHDFTRLQGFGYSARNVKKGIINPGYDQLYDRKESMQMGTNWLQNMGHLGGYKEAIKATTAYGMDFGTLSEMGGTARRMGGSAADQKNTFIDMMAQGVATGLKEVKFDDYLKVQNSLLSSMVSRGPVNSSSVMSMLASTVKNGGSYFQNNPDSVARAMTGLSSGFSEAGAGGSNAGLLIPEMLKAYPKAGGAFGVKNLTAFGLFGGGQNLLNEHPNMMPGQRRYFESIGMFDKSNTPEKRMQVLWNMAGAGKSDMVQADILAKLAGGDIPESVNQGAFLNTWYKNQGTPMGDEARDKFLKTLDERSKTVLESDSAKLQKMEISLSKIATATTEVIAPVLVTLGSWIGTADVADMGKKILELNSDPSKQKGILDKQINGWLKKSGFLGWVNNEDPNGSDDPELKNDTIGGAKFKVSGLQGQMEKIRKHSGALYNMVENGLGGITVTSVTGDEHVPGSKHYRGEATDISVKGMDQATIQQTIDTANQDSRLHAAYHTKNARGQWSPHIHIDQISDYDKQQEQAGLSLSDPLGMNSAVGQLPGSSKTEEYLRTISEASQGTHKETKRIAESANKPRGSAPNSQSQTTNRATLYN